MKRKFALGVALVAVLAAGTTYALAASGATTTQTINACVDDNGKLRLVSAASNCKKDESPISWNTVGPQGAAGPQGVAGPQGAAGRDGRDGASGGAAADPNAVDAAVSVTGQRQGSFSNKRIPVIAVTHEIVSPRDAASGLPTGKRQHKPITITKPIDASTPLFLNALTTNENLTEVVITYTRDGKDVFQVTLTNASLATYQSHGNNEKWSFTYQKIKWVWLDGGITAEDDWETPNA